MRRIGRLGSGESATTQERADGVLEFNRMLGRWNVDMGLLYFETSESLTWATGQASRTIGTGGNLSTSRPQLILSAYLTVSGAEHPLTVITNQAYQAIDTKTLTSSIPQYLAYNPTFTTSLGTLYIWPTPSTALTLLLTSMKPLADITGAGTITLPPGYEDAIVSNLAVRFADGDFATQIPQTLRDDAMYARESIARANWVTQELWPDYMATGLNGGDDIGRYTT